MQCKNGLHEKEHPGICKPCKAAAQRRYAKSHPETITKHLLKWQRKNKAKLARYNRKWRDERLGEFKNLYGIWATMKARCNTPSCTGYQYYGARGIQVCNQWMDWDNFRVWAMNHGYVSHQNLTIDRRDSNGNYEPANCHWIPKSKNVRGPARKAA